jgi:cysteine desulfurase / selenocysteine lyase
MNKYLFPIFSNHKTPLIYLDNGATTQKPKIMSEAMAYFYENFNSNIGRSAYKLAYHADQAYEKSRANIASFFNSDKESITFSLGATHSLNMVAHILAQKIPNGSKIVLSILDHHANILPWQVLAKEKNLELIYIEDFEVLANPQNLSSSFFEGVSVIALPHVTNTTGQILPVEKWIQLAREKGIYSVIDGSQAVCSFVINLSELNPDFYVFSAHKLYGPMGLGILYINKKLIKLSSPLLVGGGIIEDVTKENFTLIDNIRKFEAGTPNIANVYAFSEVLTWLQKMDWEKDLSKIKILNNKLKNRLLQLDYIEAMITDSSLPTSHIFSFNIKNVHAHDVGTYLDEKGICVRVGKHCAYPLHQYLNVNSSIRVSWGIYNDEADLTAFIHGIKSCYEFFKD